MLEFAAHWNWVDSQAHVTYGTMKGIGEIVGQNATKSLGLACSETTWHNA